jgi:transposase
MSGSDGGDMSVFPSDDHLVSWARLCPRSDESAGKRRNKRTLKGSRWLKPTLVQIAWAAIRTKHSAFRSYFYRLRPRTGPKKAVVAVAARILRTIYAMLRDGTRYEPALPQELSERQKQRELARLLHRVRQLGYDAELRAA